jgi:hypothetical protein
MKTYRTVMIVFIALSAVLAVVAVYLYLSPAKKDGGLL